MAFVGFPAVVKPASRTSSWGVVAVRDLAELGRALADFHDHEIVLVEELVAGQEYSVESLVQHGSIVFASATTKETQANGRTFVELSHSVPEPRPELCELLLPPTPSCWPGSGSPTASPTPNGGSPMTAGPC